MLTPKKTKHRKWHKGRRRFKRVATRGYDISFGKYALQFHEVSFSVHLPQLICCFVYETDVCCLQERDGPRTEIILGTWNKQAHINWLQANPNKKPKPSDTRG